MVGMESVLLNDTGLRKLDEYKMDLIASGRYRPTSERYTETYIEMPISNWLFRLELVNSWMKAGLR